MKIEMLEDVKHGAQLFAVGEVRVVDEETGKYFCGLGWAKDVDGVVETKPRDPQAARLAPASVVHGIK